MVRKYSIIILLIVFPFFGLSQHPEKNDNLRRIIRDFGQAEVVIPTPASSEIDLLTRSVSIRSVDDKYVRIVLSPITVEWFISGNFNYQITEPVTPKGVVSSLTMEQAMDWDVYPTYPQYISIMRFLAENYPSLCILDTIGKTPGGKLVLALKISDNVNEDEIEPEVFYSSTMHGDETGGFIMMLRLSEYLLQNYDINPRIKHLVDNLEIWINPLANPDGTYNNGDEIYMPVRGNKAGFDLNRNFPDPMMTGTIFQKETIDMMKFMESHRFILSANFHSGEEVVNFPWDRWKRDHADKKWFYSVCRAYADTVHLYAPSGYMVFLDNGVTNGYSWYPVYGSRQDYMTWQLHGREITVELDVNFVTPANDLPELWENNRRSMIRYLENALYGIQGTVTDKDTGKPVPAMIYIEGHDKDNSETYADSVTGEFARFLVPGSWNIKFSADNYRDTVIYGVQVQEALKTELSVAMKRNINKIDTTETTIPVLYPNPASLIIKAVLPASLSGEINIQIINSTGAVISNFVQKISERIPLRIDVSSMPNGLYFIKFTGRNPDVSYVSRFIVDR